MTETLKAYAALQKKYDLPSYEELDRYFDLDSLDDKKNILRAVLHKIVGTLEVYGEVLSSLIQPDTSISVLYESKLFEEHEHAHISQLYKRIMSLHRGAYRVLVLYDDKAASEYIRSTFPVWKEVATSLHVILTQLEVGWQKDEPAADTLGYMG